MKANIFFYRNVSTRDEICNNLTGFGAEIFYRAKIIRELELFEKLNDNFDNEESNLLLSDFLLSYLVDVVCIITFFENYLKAILISKGFYVNKINKIPGYVDIAKRQYKEPIFINDIPNDDRCEVDLENKTFFHPAIMEMTIGMKILLGSKSYIEKYKLDSDIIDLIQELISDRNKLHFYYRPEFVFSKDKIEKLKKIKSFVAKDLGIVLSK